MWATRRVVQALRQQSGMSPVTYVIIFDVVPERHDEFPELLGGVLDAM